MDRWYVSSRAQLGLSLLLASLVSVGLFVLGAVHNHSTIYNYLIWNLFLAWIPLGLSLWLQKTLRRKVWSSWEALFVTFLWIGFLPNSFYMVTDYIHLREVPRADILFDVVMFTSFIVTSLAIGYISLYMVHNELLARMRRRTAGTLIAFTILLCSFAIYLGRDLRWNSWDILINPGSLLFDVSDRFLHPGAHPQTFITTVTFFTLLGTFYVMVRAMARTMRLQKIASEEHETA